MILQRIENTKLKDPFAHLHSPIVKGVANRVSHVSTLLSKVAALSTLVLTHTRQVNLSEYSVSGALAAPQLTLFDSSDNVIAINTGWENAPVLGYSAVQAGVQAATASVMRSVYAFSLPAGSTDCAMVVTLPPGAYTAQVRGVNGSTGVALAEVYDIP